MVFTTVVYVLNNELLYLLRNNVPIYFLFLWHAWLGKVKAITTSIFLPVVVIFAQEKGKGFFLFSLWTTALLFELMTVRLREISLGNKILSLQFSSYNILNFSACQLVWRYIISLAEIITLGWKWPFSIFHAEWVAATCRETRQYFPQTFHYKGENESAEVFNHFCQ